jgi:hypothetical protein
VVRIGHHHPLQLTFVFAGTNAILEFLIVVRPLWVHVVVRVLFVTYAEDDVPCQRVDVVVECYLV